MAWIIEARPPGGKYFFPVAGEYESVEAAREAEYQAGLTLPEYEFQVFKKIVVGVL